MSDVRRVAEAFRVRGSRRFRKRMHWNSVYGGSGLVLGGGTCLFLTGTPRSDGLLAFGAFALAFGLIFVIGGVVGLVRLRSEPKRT